MRTRAAFVSAFLLVGSTVLLAGCASSGGSSDDFDIRQGEVATRALPRTRRVDHHPDSLGHLRLTPTNGRIKFELSDSYEQMLLEWTARVSGGRSGYFRTHATLWSKELSVASLIPERGVETLSEELARDMIGERLAEYDSTVQIDVYVFAPSIRRANLSDLQLDRAGRRVYLRLDEDGNQYKPTHVESSVPLNAYHAGRRTIYGRNTVFFDRYTEDGRDLLDARELRLHVRPGNSHFSWRFPASASAAVSRTD